MRVLLLALGLAASVSAQPALVGELTVDQEVYGAGEPIAVRYAVRNEGARVATVWASSGCGPSLTVGTFASPGEAVACTLEEVPVAVGAGDALEWTWEFRPDAVGVPEVGGEQTVSAFIGPACGPGQVWNPSLPGGPEDYDASATRAYTCRLGASATITAPAARGGVLQVAYTLTDSASVTPYERAYAAVVQDSAVYGAARDRVVETWRVSGAPFLGIVAALDADAVIEAYPFRALDVTTRYVVSTDTPAPGGLAVSAPTPNPTAASASVTVRLGALQAVTVDLLDARGRRVAVLHDGPLAAGADPTFTLRTEALPAGVYVVRVVGETVRQTRRLVVAR